MTALITMLAGNIKAEIQKVTQNLDRAKNGAIAAAGQALDFLAEEMLNQAQAAAPVQTGRLKESGTAEPLSKEGTELVKRWGFNLKYARIRDQGGTIRPKKAGGLLAIPLSDAAKRLASPLEMGDRLKLVPLNGRLFLVEREPKGQGRTFQRGDLRYFHWLLVPEVTQQGNGYVTKTVDANRERVPQYVAERIGKAIAGGGA